MLPMYSPFNTYRLIWCVYVRDLFDLCSEATVAVSLASATLATIQSVAVCNLWDSMTSIEQASFVHSVVGICKDVTDCHDTSFTAIWQCVVDEDMNKLLVKKTDEDYPNYILKLCSENDAASIESAKRCIVVALNDDDNGAKQNMLVKLVINKEATLAMKLLREMAASLHWRSYVKRSLDAECINGGTLLHEAAKYGCVEVLGLRGFITTEVVSNLRQDDNGDTPLHLAAAYGHTEDVKVLLEKSLHRKIFTPNNKGWTPLHYAVSNKRPCRKIISELIKHVLENDPLALDAQSEDCKNTALHLACQNENADETIMKLFERANPSICNADQRTPLHLAAEREHDPQPIAALLEIFLPRMNKSDLTVKAANLTVKGSKKCKDVQNSRNDPICCILGEIVPGPNCPNNNRQLHRKQFFGGKLHIDTLLNLCAKNGHRDAVALLLQYGADPKYVLHVIVEESAKRKDKVDELLDVYEAVVENVLVPDSRWLIEDEERDTKKGKENIRHDIWEPIWEPVLNEYMRKKRVRMMQLVEEPNNSNKNVIERAIELGAKDLLKAIVNTPNVFRFDDVGEVSKDFGPMSCPRLHYDVTNMIPSTMAKNENSNTCCGRRVGDTCTTSRASEIRPAKSYMQLIADHESVWRQHDILQIEPFKKLSKSYVGFMKRVDLLLGITHLIYIIMFSVNFLPTKCSLNKKFLLNLNECNTTVGGDLARDPAWGWIIWPVILLAYQLYAFISYVINVCSTVFNLNRHRQQYAEARNINSETEEILVKILLKLIDKVLFYIFSIMAIVWCLLTPDSYTRYLQEGALVFLCGWMITFLLFCRITKGTFVLSVVLKSVLIRDILFTFVPVFVVILIAFTCTLYVLQLTELDSVLLDFEATFYEIFSTAFTLGNLYDYTLDPEYKDAGGNRGFLKAVYVAYLSLTALVLFNYLIAMMSARYDQEAPNAENQYRFDILIDAMNMRGSRSAFAPLWCIHQVDYWFKFFCMPQCTIKHDKHKKQHYISVQRWRPWQKESTENLTAKSSDKAVDVVSCRCAYCCPEPRAYICTKHLGDNHGQT